MHFKIKKSLAIWYERICTRTARRVDLHVRFSLKKNNSCQNLFKLIPTESLIDGLVKNNIVVYHFFQVPAREIVSEKYCNREVFKERILLSHYPHNI